MSRTVITVEREGEVLVLRGRGGGGEEVAEGEEGGTKPSFFVRKGGSSPVRASCVRIHFKTSPRRGMMAVYGMQHPPMQREAIRKELFVV